MPDTQLLLIVALLAMLAILIGGTWFVMRIGMIRNPVGASMFVAGLATAIGQLPNGRILSDWMGIVVNAVILGVPIGLVWLVVRRRQRKQQG